MALCRPFRRNACACYMVGNTELAHFFNFARGGEFYYTFDQCILKQCFSNKGDVRHGLCCTWLSAAHSSATRVLATSWVMLGTHDLFCFARGGVSCVPFKSISKIELFPITGDILHGLCRCPWLSVAWSGTTRVLATLWAMLGMQDLLQFALWHCLGCQIGNPF